VMPELKSAYLTAQNFKTALAVRSWGSKQGNRVNLITRR